jgi:hypothetical protein
MMSEGAFPFRFSRRSRRADFEVLSDSTTTRARSRSLKGK